MNSTTQPSLSIAPAPIDTKRQSETHWIWLGAAVITAVFVLSNSATPLYVRWQHRFDFSSGMLTSIFAAYIGGLLGTLPFAGQLSDRYGRKPVILPGLVLALVACGLYALAHSVAWLIVARLLTGVAVGVIVSAGMAAVIDVGGPENRKLASLASSVCMVLGAGAGPLLAGIVSTGFSEQGADPAPWIFGIEGIVLLGAMTIVWKMPLIRRAPKLKEGEQHTLHLPSIHRSNRGRLMQGIAVFAPGLASTSFVLALGPSLLSRRLHLNSLAKVHGSLAWHSHEEEDELFYILSGRLRIEMEAGSVDLCAGDAYVVPRGVRHNPVADEECLLMLIERKSTLHTGNVTTEKTRSLAEQLRPL